MRAWEAFLKNTATLFGDEVVKQWLLPLKIIKFDACNLYLEASDTFQINWFDEHIRPLLCDQPLYNENGNLINVDLQLKNQPPKIKKSRPLVAKASPFELAFDKADPLCSLENFIPGTSQPLAYRLLQEIAHSLSCSPSPSNISLNTFNPIYLYGDSGTGKSHLLAAMWHQLSRAGLKVVYVQAETFTDHVIKAIRAGEMHQFRQAYRNIDSLIIDGVEKFARKTATQEELFHTFNTLHTAGKQIILSAHCAPNELQAIEPRLISRFEWGIVLELPHAKEVDRLQILLNKSKALGYALPNKIATFLLETFVSNVKMLIRALEALVLREHMSGLKNLTPLQAKRYLSDLIEEEQSTALTSEKIIHKVAEHYGIKIEDILGKSQCRECTLPRQLAVYLCRDILKMPYKHIGSLFDRDHSTIITSCKQVLSFIAHENAEITTALRQIRLALMQQPHTYGVGAEFSVAEH